MFPFNKDKSQSTNVPKPGFIPAINYWRALQIIKQTPFRELWAATKKEAPGLLAVFVFVGLCLLSLVFTVCWLFITTVKLVYRSIAGLFSWASKK